jgi:hypothetical protein
VTVGGGESVRAGRPSSSVTFLVSVSMIKSPTWRRDAEERALSIRRYIARLPPRVGWLCRSLVKQKDGSRVGGDLRGTHEDQRRLVLKGKHSHEFHCYQ